MRVDSSREQKFIAKSLMLVSVQYGTEQNAMRGEAGVIPVKTPFRTLGELLTFGSTVGRDGGSMVAMQVRAGRMAPPYLAPEEVLPAALPPRGLASLCTIPLHTALTGQWPKAKAQSTLAPLYPVNRLQLTSLRTS